MTSEPQGAIDDYCCKCKTRTVVAFGFADACSSCGYVWEDQGHLLNRWEVTPMMSVSGETPPWPEPLNLKTYEECLQYALRSQPTNTLKPPSTP